MVVVIGTQYPEESLFLCPFTFVPLPKTTSGLPSLIPIRTFRTQPRWSPPSHLAEKDFGHFPRFNDMLSTPTTLHNYVFGCVSKIPQSQHITQKEVTL